jgi:mono/diheme cytochrome c family protein
VLLSDLLEKSLESVPAERRSLYDLLIVKGAGGTQALLPRAFVIKYPILLASRREGKDLGARGPMTVLPWTSNSKIRGETASLITLFVEGVSSIELANFKEQYPEYLLRKRTEPAAVRGEKLFREGCMTCHAVGKGPKVSEISSEAKLKHLLDTGHPEVEGMIKLTQAERRSLVRFLEMLKE